MANIPMRTLKIPGLADTYTIPTAPEHIGAAPAGYGYGEAPVALGTADNDTAFIAALNKLFDKTAGKTRQVMFHMGGVTYIGTLWNAGNGYGTLTANSYIEANSAAYLTKIVRNCVNRNWQPWEYENPPLMNNTEYRTTERYAGKPVYVKRINYGTLGAANATVTIPLGVSTVTDLVDFVIIHKNASNNVYMFPSHEFYSGVASLTGYFDLTIRAFVLQTHKDMSEDNAIVTVKYTKD